MTAGLQRTLEILETTQNRAGLWLLLDVLRYGSGAVADRALEVVLSHTDRDLQFELVKGFHQFADQHQARIVSEGHRLSLAIRRAYLDPDETTYQNACQLIRAIPDYDQAGLLLGSLGHGSERQSDAAAIFEHLANKLADQLSLPPTERTLHDLEGVRQRFAEAMREGMRNYVKHHVDAIPRGFLVVADDDSLEVPEMVGDERHPCHEAILSALRRDSHRRIVRWIYLLLNQQRAPRVVLTILRDREDLPFVEGLLEEIQFLAEPLIARSLGRVPEIRWLDPQRPILLRLTESQQAAAVIFAVHTGVSVEQKVEIIALILDEGHRRARHSAACALAKVPGADASRLVLACLEDEDLEIELAATQQVRGRGLPNALGLLVARLDHSDARIQQAARDALSDYRFDRYLSIFDRLDESVRRSAGSIIWKIDPAAPETLRAELHNQAHRASRVRAAKVARMLDVVGQVVSEMVELLGDKDHMVRREAIESLATVDAPDLVGQLSRYAADREHHLREGARRAIDLLRSSARASEVRLAATAAAERLGIVQSKPL